MRLPTTSYYVQNRSYQWFCLITFREATVSPSESFNKLVINFIAFKVYVDQDQLNQILLILTVEVKQRLTISVTESSCYMLCYFFSRHIVIILVKFLSGIWILAHNKVPLSWSH